jgi:hypothetical protein
MVERFVVGADAENASWLAGIIVEARVVRDAGELYNYQSERLEAIYDGLNEPLP